MHFFQNLPQLIVVNAMVSIQSGKYPNQDQLDAAVKQKGYAYCLMCEMENENCSTT
jgi:hypothetical protein